MQNEFNRLPNKLYCGMSQDFKDLLTLTYHVSLTSSSPQMETVLIKKIRGYPMYSLLYK